MRRWAVFLAMVCSAGCAFDTQPCESDDDCPDGTTCRVGGGADIPFCIASPPDATDPDDDMTGSSPDQGTENSKQDEGVDPNVELPTCEEVDDCGDAEPNQAPRDILLTEFPKGCAQYDLETWSHIHNDLACSGDVDDFTIEFIRCENQTFKLTATLESTDRCSGSTAKLELFDAPFDCSDESVRCEEVAEGYRITALIGSKDYPRPIETVTLRVTGGRLGARYRLTTSISQ